MENRGYVEYTCMGNEFCLFKLMLCIPVSSFSVMSRDFLDGASTKQRIKCLA